MKMAACPFCQRTRRGPFEQDWHALHVVAFAPLNPVTVGHMLIVPREHVVDAAEAPDVAAAAMRCAAAFARDMRLDANIITSIGPAATQTVRHLHLHVVPRRDGDGLHLPWTRRTGPLARLFERTA